MTQSTPHKTLNGPIRLAEAIDAAQMFSGAGCRPAVIAADVPAVVVMDVEKFEMSLQNLLAEAALSEGKAVTVDLYYTQSGAELAFGLTGECTENFMLPFDFPDAEQQRESPKTALAKLPPSSLLIAEDDKFNQRYLSALLDPFGHCLTFVETGQGAVQAVKTAGQKPFDLVLMDVKMPDMNGFEATQQIRALPAPASQIPIIALTALKLHEVSADCMAAGMDYALQKPISPEDLLRGIIGVLDKKKGASPRRLFKGGTPD